MAERGNGLPDGPLHALVADADLDRLAELTFRVARLGLTVSSAADRSEVWSAIDERPPDLAVFAAPLALAHDADLLRRLARLGAAVRTPFILVAAEHGAHGAHGAAATRGEAPPSARGVLVYPCAWRDLEATVQRVLRQRASGAAGAAGDAILHDGPIAVDGAVDTVAVHGTRVRVSTAELALIRLLLQAPGGVADAEIHARLWSGRAARHGRALVSLASRLRRKLGPLGVRLERAAAVRGYRLRW